MIPQYFFKAQMITLHYQNNNPVTKYLGSPYPVHSRPLTRGRTPHTRCVCIAFKTWFIRKQLKQLHSGGNNFKNS